MPGILRRITDEIANQLKKDLEEQARRILRRAIRIIVLSVLGLTFLLVGFVFILYGIGTFLAQFMFGGLAWGLVGLVTALIGVILILLVRR